MTEWPMRDRMPERRSFVDYPLSLPLSLLWKTRVSGSAVSQATFASGTVYVNTYNRLYALDAETGAVLWDFRPLQSRLSERYSTNNSTPVIWQDRIYITDFAGLLYCVDRHDGHALWERERLRASNDSPVIYRERLFIHCADPGRPVALDRRATSFGYLCLTLDGERVWFAETRGKVSTLQAAIVNDVLIFGDVQSYLYGLDVSTGERRWEVDIKQIVSMAGYDRPNFPSGPVISVGEVVIVQIGIPRVTCAFAANDGRFLWRHETEEVQESFATDQRFLYYVSRLQGAARVELTSGSRQWLKITEGQRFGLSAAPSGLVVGSTYFAGFNDSAKLVAFRTDDGEVAWTYTAEGGFTAAPIFVDGKLIVGNDDQHVYCFIEA